MNKIVEKVARAIHDARYGNDYPNALVRTWEQEDVAGKEYCERLAQAALTAHETAMAEWVKELEIDCEFLLSVIDSCDEAEAPSCEMEPEDVANIERIRAALANQSREKE